MIKQVIFGLFVGLIVTLFIAQHDRWVQDKVGHSFKELFEKSFDCSMSFIVKKVNFFSLNPKLVLEQVIVKPHEGRDWQWQCNRYEMTFSWKHLFEIGTIDMTVAIDDLNLSSTMSNGSCAIAPHLAKIMFVSSLPIPIFLKLLVLSNATFHIEDKNTRFDGIIKCHSSVVKIDKLLKSTIYITDGQVTIDSKKVVNAPTGNLKITVDTIKNAAIKGSMHVDGSFELPYLGEYNTCYVRGVWNQHNARFSLRSAYDLCAIDPIIITKRNDEIYLKLIARFPLSCPWRFLVNDNKNDCIDGNGFLTMQAISSPSKQRIDGQLIFEDVQYKKNILCDINKIFFAKHNNHWHGDITLRSHSAECSGSWHWSEQTQTGELALANSNSIKVPHTKWWQILPQGFSCQVKVDKPGLIHGAYKGTATNIIRNTTTNVSGTTKIHNNTIDSTGTINKQHYLLKGTLKPKIHLERYIHFDENGKPLVSLFGSTDHHRGFKGSVNFSFLKLLLQKWFGYDMQGQGDMQLDGKFDTNSVLFNIHFADTIIRLPQTYNFIDGFNASICYDIAHSKLMIHDMHCSLHTGSIYSPRARVLFDSDAHCRFIHMPLLFDRCLLNIKKDLFASVSGGILFQQTAPDQHPLIRGNFIIDRAQLKENLFSDNFQKQLINHTGNLFGQPGIDMGCDISIETKSPVRVDTAFLKTDAKVQLQVQRTINNPIVTGAISLLSGSLNFPYKPLYITKGSIYFLPNQLYDPLIELIAKNKIKKYNIGFQVTGSLHAYHMLFDSSPPLTNEQVIALLLIGSEQESMPALSIMQNMQQIIFGTNQSSRIRDYFKPILRPFSSISLIPRFSDQSGRGGLRGALEIDVNDRMRVLIQKNFSLTEDTKFELEYLFSDDITLRAIRDERRDIGSEIELRWKF